MKLWTLLLVALLGVAGTHRAASQTTQQVAQASATGKSFAINGMLTEALQIIYFTLFDGKRGRPTNQRGIYGDTNSNFTASSELRPRAGQPGVYETDYGIINFFFGNEIEYGSMTFILPTEDADGNGLADFLQISNAVSLSVTGAIQSDLVLAGTNRVTGTNFGGMLTRDAGTAVGSITAGFVDVENVVYFGQSASIIFRWNGEVSYQRGSSSKLNFRMTSLNESLTYTGMVAFTAINNDLISVPQFLLYLTNGVRITVSPMMLTRSGNKYAGTMKISDGFLVTPWKDYVEWVLEIEDFNDANTNGIPDLSDLTLTPDLVKPKVVITTPAANAKLIAPTNVVRGTASDLVGVREVLYRIGDGEFQPAANTTNWSFPIELKAGTNTVQVKSVDFRGNESLLATRSFFFAVSNTFVLTISPPGGGTVTPDLNGRPLEVGRGYALTAKPAAGLVFSNWIGGSITSTTLKLNFLMESNLTLTANFVTNPFPRVQGVYTGLFYENDETRHESSGHITVTVMSNGKFTGSLRAAGLARAASLMGQFDLDGRASLDVPRPGLSTLEAELFLNLGTPANLLQGLVFGTNWESVLSAERQVYSRANRAPYAGNYTVVIPGVDGDPLTPTGDGPATFKIGDDGVAAMMGNLADGTPFTYSAPVSELGDLPIYLPLQNGRGSLVGWLLFFEGDFDDYYGDLTWTKAPTNTSGNLYPVGFTVYPVSASGARYDATNDVLTTSNAVVAFERANSDANFSNEIVIGAKAKVTSPGTNKLTLTFKPLTGAFDGTVADPSTNRTYKLKGVIHKKLGAGFGYFLEPSASSRVVIEPELPEP